MQRKPLILGSLLLAAFAINLDTTIVNVALPTLVRELHASTTELVWIVDAYNLVFAALVLGGGQPRRPGRAKGRAAHRTRRVRCCDGRRRPLHEPGRADRGARGHGARRRADLPRDIVAADERFHRTRRARPGDRSVGRDDRGRDRGRADRRRLAARALLLVERLLCARAGRRARRAAGDRERADLARSAGAAGGPGGRRAVDRRDGAPDLHDHRGAQPRLGERAQCRRLRRGARAARRVRRVGATRAARRCSTSGCSATCASARRAAR